MTHPRFWSGRRAAADPPAARAFYRHPRWQSLALAAALACSIAGTGFQLTLICHIFTDHLQRHVWRSDGARDVWGNLREVSRWIAGKWLRLFFGDCDDFAVMLLMALVRAGIPRGACCLCMVILPGGPPRHTAAAPRRGGPGEGHLVLVVQTEQGSLVCDPLQPKPLWGDAPALAGYARVAMEAPPEKPGAVARWVSLEKAVAGSLADVVKGRS